MNLADRIAVMFEGRIVGILDAASVTQEKLGLMISGVAMKIERRLTPADSPLAITTAMVLAVLAATLVTSLLFVLYGANPFRAYFALFHEPFATHARLWLYAGAYRAVNVDCPGHHRQLAIGLWLPGVSKDAS